MSVYWPVLSAGSNATVTLMGAVPAEFIRAFTWQTLVELLIGAIIFLAIAVTVFRLGLKRYESGSAIQIEV